jgi:hypothetical protein
MSRYERTYQCSSAGRPKPRCYFTTDSMNPCGGRRDE